MILTLVMVVLFVLLAIGTPVGFAMAGSGVLGLYLIGGMPMLTGILQTAPLSAVTSYELITIPMFLLMAEFVLVSGIADDLFKATAAWVGRVPGGLGMATALAGAGFGAICGTSTASAATLSATSLPAMLKQGYEPRMAAGVVAISGTLAMLIPPSVALVIYGLLAEVNIGALLIGGVIPGVLVTITIMATVWFLAWQDPSRAPAGPSVTLARKIPDAQSRRADAALVRHGDGRDLFGHRHADRSLGARRLRRLLPRLLEGKDRSAEPAQRPASRSPWHLHDRHDFAWRFDLRLFLYADPGDAKPGGLCGGPPRTALDDPDASSCSATSCSVPSWTRSRSSCSPFRSCCPLIKSLGYDPLWFGVIKIVTAEVGMITPPVGLNCFVVARYSGRPVGEVFHGVFPHFVAHLFAIAILVVWPQIILWLPIKMGY